ncbi:hypothetical protein QYF50_02010 [Paenibacillus vini]|uniref:hypothetical protein n=1 Tax=Paenibacillus vini TaxID=1476024 RepID=UPI0025B68F17|nr:hypothetical protein [Paenibacillus vini]MDN4066655.1 hypothetical protein [Paenibacillus vini]
MGKLTRKSSSSMKKGTKSGRGSMGPGDVINIIKVGIDGVNSVTNMIHSIQENRYKTEQLKFEGKRLAAEIIDRISDRENETLRLLKSLDVELKNIDKEIRSGELQYNENIKKIEMEMENNKLNHEYRMRGLDIIEKVVDAALEQYRYYTRDVVIIDANTSSVLNTQLLSNLNMTIQSLNTTIAHANIGGYLTTYNEE